MSPSPAVIAAIHQLPFVTDRTMTRLFEHGLFAIPYAEWSGQQLLMAGLSPERCSALLQELTTINIVPIEQVLNRLAITVLHRQHPDYPPLLQEIPSPPTVLYVRGNIHALATTALAVVGTRIPTAYGLMVTEQLIPAVATAGITIVSGLARGIDASAHHATLKAGGHTVAVLGSGIDMIYPWEHQSMAEKIIAGGGALISEFPLGAKPERHHFPQRNRIISGLARAVLLVEAGEKSGALITAKFAVDQNRDVLTVPGPITSPHSVGVNSWLKLGAKPITSVNDILEVFSMLPFTSSLPLKTIVAANPTEESILAHLSTQPTHIDVLVEKCRLDTSAVSAALSLMEIEGKVRHYGGMQYTLAS